jgi:hypothetical protein
MEQKNICTFCRRNAVLKDIIDTTCTACINNVNDDLPLLDFGPPPVLDDDAAVYDDAYDGADADVVFNNMLQGI